MARGGAAAVLVLVFGAGCTAGPVAGAGGTGPPGPRPAATPAGEPAPTGRPGPGATSPGAAGKTGPTPAKTAARPTRLRYTFPVRPAADASFGRAHHDYPATDIFAPCGDSFLAPTDGVVLEIAVADRWNPRRNDGATRGGLSVTVRGDDGVRYYGSHLHDIAAGIRAGARVVPGTHLGTVGRTGSARTTPCHLHFGISPPCRLKGDWWTRRGVVSPWPYLTAWLAGRPLSPAREVESWRRVHGCPGQPGPGAG